MNWHTQVTKYIMHTERFENLTGQSAIYSIIIAFLYISVLHRIKTTEKHTINTKMARPMILCKLLYTCIVIINTYMEAYLITYIFGT